ncbi:SWIM zinc finger family protein [Enterococcus avium]|uniref:SWIM zinc finger family protein n=1 Tax=Enterococcus avium TaxID=33945 RepID=UPI0035DB8DDC
MHPRCTCLSWQYKLAYHPCIHVLSVKFECKKSSSQFMTLLIKVSTNIIRNCTCDTYY